METAKSLVALVNAEIQKERDSIGNMFRGEYQNNQAWDSFVLQCSQSRDSICCATLAFLIEYSIGVKSLFQSEIKTSEQDTLHRPQPTNCEASLNWRRSAGLVGHVQSGLLVALDDTELHNDREKCAEKIINACSKDWAKWNLIDDICYYIGKYFYKEYMKKEHMENDEDQIAISWLSVCGQRCPKALYRLAKLHWANHDYANSYGYAWQSVECQNTKACFFVYCIASEHSELLPSNKIHISKPRLHSLLHAAAAEDHEQSCLTLGEYYFINTNFESAVYWFEMCKLLRQDQKDEIYNRALYYLATCFEHGFCYPKNISQAWELYNQAGAAGDVFAMLALAKFYMGDSFKHEKENTQEQIVKPDPEMGFKLFQHITLIAEKEKTYKNARPKFDLFTKKHNIIAAEAFYECGRCFMDGIGTKSDVKAALHCWEKAFLMKWKPAALALANYYTREAHEMC